MKRIKLLIIFFIFIVILITGCRNIQTEPPNENFLGLIMVNGIYEYTGYEIPVKIDKSAIIGKITSIKYLERLGNI